MYKASPCCCCRLLGGELASATGYAGPAGRRPPPLRILWASLRNVRLLFGIPGPSSLPPEQEAERTAARRLLEATTRLATAAAQVPSRANCHLSAMPRMWTREHKTKKFYLNGGCCAGDAVPGKPACSVRLHGGAGARRLGCQGCSLRQQRRESAASGSHGYAPYASNLWYQRFLTTCLYQDVRGAGVRETWQHNMQGTS